MQPQDALAWQLQQGVAIGVAIFPIVSFLFLTPAAIHRSQTQNTAGRRRCAVRRLLGPAAGCEPEGRRRELLRCALAPPLLAHRGRRWRSGRGSRAEWAR